MNSSSPIVGAATGTLSEALAFVKHHAKRFDDAIEYVNAVFEFAPKAGIDPAIVIAQSAHETGNYTSDAWVTRLNPAGLGITDGPDLGIGFATGRDAALAQLVHLSAYSQSPLAPALKAFKKLDARYQAVFDQGWQNTVRTLNDLTGKWATDQDYPQKIAQKGNLIFKNTSSKSDSVSLTSTGVSTITFGRVPHPSFTDRLITEKPEGIGWSALGKRKPKGVVLHRMLGTLWGTDGWFRNPTVEALTDYGVGVQAIDGANDGVILRWNDPTGYRSGWASGPALQPYGDGLKFINRYGVDAVNRDLVSIEISGQYETEWSDKSFESVAQLVAFWADWARIPYDQFPMVNESVNGKMDMTRSFIVWHQELCGPQEKVCPGSVVMNQTDRLIKRVQAILKHYQITKEYQLDLKIVWPNQSSGPVGKLWESECKRRKSYGRPDSKVWDVSDKQGGKLYLFSDGLLIRKWTESGQEKAAVV
jgi:hypothetical protein